MTIGIVGVGNVGIKVAKVARELGMRVLLNDLPREEKEGSTNFCSLQFLAEECDVITFHVPLYKEGKYKTFHLADEVFFRSLKRSPIIINTSRGEVIETTALLKALENGLISDAVIDVWENEPDINLSLLYKVFIGTPISPDTQQTEKLMLRECLWTPCADTSAYKLTITLLHPNRKIRSS